MSSFAHYTLCMPRRSKITSTLQHDSSGTSGVSKISTRRRSNKKHYSHPAEATGWYVIILIIIALSLSFAFMPRNMWYIMRQNMYQRSFGSSVTPTVIYVPVPESYFAPTTTLLEQSLSDVETNVNVQE